MARIWGNDSGGKTATGVKFEGNVIAVPGKYKLGETYQIIFTANGRTQTIDAVAVDRTSVSFAAPKNSDLYHQVHGKNVEVKLKHVEVRKALAVDAPTDKPVRRAVAVAVPAPVTTNSSNTVNADGLIKPIRNLSLSEENNLIGALNNGGIGNFKSAREVHASPERAGEMAAAIIKQYPRPENKLEQLASVFRDQPDALYAINQKYNMHLLTCDVSSLPGYHPHPGRERVAQSRELARPFAAHATLRDLPQDPVATAPLTAQGKVPQPAKIPGQQDSMQDLFGRR